MTRYGFTVSHDTLEQLKAVKQQFDDKAHTTFTWNEFMVQLSLLGEQRNKLVIAERVGAWFCRAKCPLCGKQNSPLKIKDGLVWGVTCSGCKRRFIVVI